MRIPVCFSLILLLVHTGLNGQARLAEKQLRVAVVGLVHTHVHWILGRENRGDIELVGIAEPNRKLAEQYSAQHGYSMSIVFPTMEEMIEKTKPDAVLAFNTIYDHLKTVQYCAPRGIHVMVEKPLAVNASHAGQMIELAREHNIHLLTNYETSWYPSNAKAYELLNGSQEIGPVRKIVFHTGHPGPIEIGCNPEFLEWLTDPVLNGGGALTDFGCYGANLATWLMRGLTPLSVTAVTQQIKPDKYPKVEDEATIVLTYPKAQVIIEASWNWPYSRKDMELYGRDGYVFCLDRDHMIFRKSEHDTAMRITANPLADGLNDPFSYLAAVIRGRTKPAPFDLSSPENNGIVVRILDAAKLSAKTGKTIPWHSTGPNQQ